MVSALIQIRNSKTDAFLICSKILHKKIKTLLLVLTQTNQATSSVSSNQNYVRTKLKKNGKRFQK